MTATAERMAGVTPELGDVVRIDSRTQEGKRLKAVRRANVVKLRTDGYTFKDIGAALGIAPETASMDCLLAGRHDLIHLHNLAHPAGAHSRRCAQADVDRDVREEQTRRQRQIEAARLEHRRCRDAGINPPWHIPQRDDEPLTEECERLVAEQARDDRGREAGARWLVALDAPVAPTKPELTRGNLIPAARGLPYQEAERSLLRELLGPLDLEDVERMDDAHLASLRRRLEAAGFAPSVQEAA